MNNEPIMANEPAPAATSIDSPIITPERPSYFGLIIGTLIALLTLIFIGLYVWSQLLSAPVPSASPTPERPTPQENNEPESTTAEAKTEVLNIVSTSDELSAIEADLEATNLGDIETELRAVEAELGQ